MSAYHTLAAQLAAHPCRWVVTGCAGFIGSHLLERLLRLDQQVVGLDNFSTGYRHNLDQVQARVTAEQWQRCTFIEGDIRDLATCRQAVAGADYVLHQSALGSVPRSIDDPIATHQSNIDGFLHMLVASRDAGVRRFVYAASSATYGDHPALPKVEEVIGNPLSPYAVTKTVNEMYADVFGRCYGFEAIGLRYFNVFGERQDPQGAYAAVIPKWIASLIQNAPVFINGDGETSRDFCYVANVVQANLLAATTRNPEAVHQVYNVAVGERTSLNQLYDALRTALARHLPNIHNATPSYREFRAGDVRHSLADISKAKRLLGYAPTHRIGEGLAVAIDWYVEHTEG